MPVTINGSGSTGSINTAVLPSSGTFATQSYADTAGGLVKIATETFYAVSSVSVNNCFTSSYANYLLIVNITAASAAGAGVDLRLRVSGVDNSSSNYYNIAMGWSANAANPTFFAEGSNGTATVGKTPIRLASGAESSGQVRISNPFATQYTTWDGMGTQTNVTTNLLFMQQTHSGTTVTTSYDGFSLIPTSGTFTGTVRVYGYRNS